MLIKNLVLQKSYWVGLAARTDNTISFLHNIHYGGKYKVQVQTDTTGSQMSEEVSFDAPLLPRVPQIKALREKNGSIYVTWEEVNWPKELKDHK